MIQASWQSQPAAHFMLVSFLLNQVPQWQVLSKAQRRYVHVHLIDEMTRILPKSRGGAGLVLGAITVGVISLKHVGVEFNQRLLIWGLLFVAATVHKIWVVRQNRDRIADFILEHESALAWIAKAAALKNAVQPR